MQPPLNNQEQNKRLTIKALEDVIQAIKDNKSLALLLVVDREDSAKCEADMLCNNWTTENLIVPLEESLKYLTTTIPEKERH